MEARETGERLSFGEKITPKVLSSLENLYDSSLSYFLIGRVREGLVHKIYNSFAITRVYEGYKTRYTLLDHTIATMRFVQANERYILK